MFYDEAYNRRKMIDYEYTEINSIKGIISAKERLIIVHSSEKEVAGSYCVFASNENYEECYIAETEDYIVHLSII